MQFPPPLIRASHTFLAAVFIAAGCAPKGPVVVEATPARSGVSGTAPAPGKATTAEPAAATWRTYGREHVDLWLHGFALLQNDSSLVPYFDLPYAARLRALRSARGVVTSLDMNHASLAATLRERPSLVSAQFLPLYFETWDELRQGFDRFLRANGEARSASTAEEARVIAIFAASFPAATDREWARRFVQALDDERTKFHHGWWAGEARQREAGRSAFETAWRETYRAPFERFLRNAGYRSGEIVFALPLGGEGRTLTPSTGATVIAIAYPGAPDSVPVAMAAFAHEVAGLVTNGVVRDQTSEADRRSGVADRYTTLAAVRGGALLLARVAPHLVSAYQRYYVRLSGARPTDPVETAFERTFAIPDSLRDAITRQLDMILGGI